MTSENLYRFAFLILMLCALLVFGRGLVHAQNSPVTASVTPKIAIVNPYKRTTFRFQWRIEPDANNRLYSLSYSCGSEVHSSQGNVDGENHPRTTERFVELTVIEDCQFMACVVRIVEGKPKTMCAWATVRTPTEGEEQ